MTKLAAALPRGEANGLNALATALIDQPEDVHIVIATIDCKKISTDIDSGDVEPTARILSVEAVHPADQARARAMMRKAHELRTGKKALPSVDLDTGEVLDLRTWKATLPGDPDSGEVLE